MGASAVPAVRRRLVGAALRRYREARGFSLQDAGRMLGCDKSKVSRIETGERGIREHDLDDLLAEYGAGDGERAVLLALAGRRAPRGWWDAYAGVLPPAVVDYLALEAAASEVLVYEGERVPALLRSGGYAMALAARDPAVPAVTARVAAEVTAQRQRTVLEAGGKELVMLIGEAALRRRVGGAQVMRGQLGRLARLSGQDGPVTVQVLPAARAHSGAGSGPLTIFRFAPVPTLGVVHLDSLAGGIFLDGQDDLAGHTAAFARLRACARSPEDSAGLLSRLVAD